MKPLPSSNFKVPEKLKQVGTYLKRNLTRKFADKQYLSINLLEPPLLAFILGYVSKYLKDGTYLFSDNKSYPVFLFMSVVVALFLGLTVSAEEIFRDRKILEREKYLNISRLSYLLSFSNTNTDVRIHLPVDPSGGRYDVEAMAYTFYYIMLREYGRA
jgi:hypothetical protein